MISKQKIGKYGNGGYITRFSKRSRNEFWSNKRNQFLKMDENFIKRRIETRKKVNEEEDMIIKQILLNEDGDDKIQFLPDYWFSLSSFVQNLIIDEKEQEDQIEIEMKDERYDEKLFPKTHQASSSLKNQERLYYFKIGDKSRGEGITLINLKEKKIMKKSEEFLISYLKDQLDDSDNDEKMEDDFDDENEKWLIQKEVQFPFLWPIQGVKEEEKIEEEEDYSFHKCDIRYIIAFLPPSTLNTRSSFSNIISSKSNGDKIWKNKWEKFNNENDHQPSTNKEEDDQKVYSDVWKYNQLFFRCCSSPYHEMVDCENTDFDHDIVDEKEEDDEINYSSHLTNLSFGGKIKHENELKTDFEMFICQSKSIFKEEEEKKEEKEEVDNEIKDMIDVRWFYSTKQLNLFMRSKIKEQFIKKMKNKKEIIEGDNQKKKKKIKIYVSFINYLIPFSFSSSSCDFHFLISNILNQLFGCCKKKRDDNENEIGLIRSEISHLSNQHQQNNNSFLYLGCDFLPFYDCEIYDIIKIKEIENDYEIKVRWKINLKLLEINSTPHLINSNKEKKKNKVMVDENNDKMENKIQENDDCKDEIDQESKDQFIVQDGVQDQNQGFQDQEGPIDIMLENLIQILEEKHINSYHQYFQSS